jgi:HEAT repeat protein
MPKRLLSLLVWQLLLVLPALAGWRNTGCGQHAVGPFGCNGAACGMNPLEQHATASVRLQQHGVLKSEVSSRYALHDDDSQIRYLAAWQLADEGAKDSIPDIAEALDVETDPWARVFIACSLVELADDRGIEALQRDCDDSTLPLEVRVEVADYLLVLKQPSCPEVVAEAFPASEVVMMHFYEEAPRQYAAIRALVLNSDDLGVKMAALTVIGNVRDFAAIPDLQAAIANESDYFVEHEMELLVEDLQNRQAQAQGAARK